MMHDAVLLARRKHTCQCELHGFLDGLPFLFQRNGVGDHNDLFSTGIGFPGQHVLQKISYHLRVETLVRPQSRTGLALLHDQAVDI